MRTPSGCSALPWRANGSEKSTATWIERQDGSRVATMKVGPCDWADAQLLAAAGDLYAAAKDARAVLGGALLPSNKVREVLARLDDAIAKAEGR